MTSKDTSTTVRNTFLEFASDAEDGAGYRSVRRSNSSPCLLASSKGDELDQITDEGSSPSPGPGQTTRTIGASWADWSDESDEDDFGFPGPPTSSGPHGLLHWPSAASKPDPDCGAKQPGASGPPPASDGCLDEAGAAVSSTRTPFAKMLALGRRGPSSLKRTPLSTKAAAFVPVLAADAAWPLPSSAELALAAGVGPAPAQGSTVMMRNLPPCFTRQRLIDLLALHGFSHHCDFLYLPVNFEISQNVGYAFLNLASQAQLERFFRVFEGFSDWGVESKQVCTVCWSETKGLEANIERYRNSPIMRDEVSDEFKPTLLVCGRPVALPKPAKPLRTLRSRKGRKLATAGASSAIAFQ